MIGLKRAGRIGSSGIDARGSVTADSHHYLAPGAQSDNVSFVLPTTATIKIGEDGRLHVGWSRCRVKVLGKRPSTYNRCQNRGRHAAECRNPARQRCNCEGHLAVNCGKVKQKRSLQEEATDRCSGKSAAKKAADAPPRKLVKAQLMSITRKM